MQQQKITTSKRLMSVEEVARELDVKKFLVKFWEKEFKLDFDRGQDGHRCYSQENLKVFVTIKDLVFNKKMSISQAKKQIKELDATFCAPIQPAVTHIEETGQGELFKQNLQIFKEQLINFKQLLDLD